MTHEEMKAFIRPKMGDKRYNHSLCVAQRAVNLADRYGCDREKAFIAGIFHDTLKEIPTQQQLKIIQDFGILFQWSQIHSPKIYHGFAASAYLKTEGVVQDDDILSAIMYHTTGKRCMTLLEKIIFIADYTGEDRTYPECIKARKIADENLEDALLYIGKETIDSLLKRGSVICTDTLDMYNQQLINLKKREEQN